MSKRALVTGVAGFIGSHVAADLVKSGIEVIGIDDLSGGFRENIPRQVDFRFGSIVEQKFVEETFSEKQIDYVFHLAAYAAEGLSHFIRHYNYENNVLGSINLINEAIKHRIERFVFTSSIAVYGANQLPMTEDLVPAPEDPYGVAKYAIELDLKCAYEMFGLPYTIFRPHNVYGRHQNIADKYRNVVGIFMNQILRGEPLTIFGDGLQTRAFSHISEISPVIASCVQNQRCVNEIFNVGADRPYTVLELAHVVSAAFNVEPDIRFLPARQEVLHAYASHDKLDSVFAKREMMTLEKGISEMAEWVNSTGPRNSVKFDSIEVTRNFPEAWADQIE